MNVRNRALVKILILVPLAVFASWLAIGPGGLVSYSPATRVGVHSVLAFWISIPAVLVLLSYNRKKQRSSILMLSALTFSIMIHIGSAAKNLLILEQGSIERTLADAVADLVDLALFGFIIAAACACFLRQGAPEEQQKFNRIVIPISLLVPIFLYGVTAFHVLPSLTVAGLMMLGWILGAIAIVGLLLVSFLVTRIKSEDLPLDVGFFVSSTLLFAISVVVLIMTLPMPAQGWELAETLQMAAFLLFCLALGVPYLKRFGFSRRNAYGFTIGIILIAYFPFLITIGIESMGLNVLVESQNLLAYSIIHIGAGLLSGMMAILLYIYPKKHTSWNHYPLVLIFGLWASVSMVSVFSLTVPSISLLGEPLTPYTIGSIITLILLGYAIWWTLHPPLQRRSHPTFLHLSLVWSGFITAIVAGEMINQVVLTSDPSLVASPIGSIIIQVANLIIMFALTFLIFLLAAKSRGTTSMELLVAIFLAMWILPNILKSFYHIWYTGWWVSEIYLFAGVLAGTPLLAWLYVRSMREVAESHGKAAMYADLLMHDITNFNQMMMTSFELLGSDDLSDDQRTKLSDDGCYVISLAGQMISNVRLLSETDRLKELQLEPMNLVPTIVQALDIFGERISPGELSVQFSPNNSKAFVLANDLLIHVFLNILYNVLDCHQEGSEVVIDITETQRDSEDFWEIIVATPCKVDEKQKSYSSGILGVTAAKTITDSLNGELSVEESSEDDKSLKKVFRVILPAAKE
ncbi:MAG: hypothetical protein RTU63_11740 [Candidatus Thorarchaeota archaeon]